MDGGETPFIEILNVVDIDQNTLQIIYNTYTIDKLQSSAKYLAALNENFNGGASPDPLWLVIRYKDDQYYITIGLYEDTHESHITRDSAKQIF
jgi:hypothetical protein